MNNQPDVRGEDVFCRICPRNCGADRRDSAGVCGETNELVIARAALHMWEEPCISGEHGSGTVFFSGCNLRCIYCQNRAIALALRGRRVTPEELLAHMNHLVELGANNINLVTPSHYVPQLVDVLKTFRNQSVQVPIVYNTSSYEKVETLKKLEGLVDVYLPDYKYSSPETAARYSNAPDYPQVALAAIDEMLRQVGEPVFAESPECEDGMIRKGVIIRHLVLPGHVEESKEAIRILHGRYGDSVYLSIMNQYTPPSDEDEKKKLPRNLRDKLSEEDYGEVVDYAIELGVENGFIQEGDTAEESFIPPFEESL